MNKLVSIVSPVYNGEKYISNFLNSVLMQSYPKIELILVDDASTDHTLEIAESYVEKFINKGYIFKIIKQQENKGQAACLNIGLSIFSGEFFSWMDADDIFYPEAIEKKVLFLENNCTIDFVISQGEIVNEENLNKNIGILKREKKEPDFLFKDLINEDNVVFGPGTVMVRRESLTKAIPNKLIYENREGQNYQILLPLAYVCRYGYLNEILFKYVVHKDSHSHIKKTYQREIQRKNNFYLIIKNTIENINCMPEKEKKYWIDYTYNHELIEKYLLSIEYRCKKDFYVYRKELKKRKIKLPTHKPYFVYTIYDFLIKKYNKYK